MQRLIWRLFTPLKTQTVVFLIWNAFIAEFCDPFDRKNWNYVLQDFMQPYIYVKTIISYHDAPDDLVGWFLVQDIVS